MAIALSLSPEEALGYLARIHSILITTTPPALINQTLNQKIYIHTLGFPDHPELMQGCHEILEEFGFTPETFPAFAIQGYVTIAEIIKYDRQRFSQDRDAHGYLDLLGEYQKHLNISSQVWGIRFTDTYILNEPLVDVLPPLGTDSGSFWNLTDIYSQIKLDK